MVVTLAGMVTLVKLRHSENAFTPMVVTLSGMVTLVKLRQPENALFPMLVTLEGMVTLVKLVHHSNALSPMVVTPSGITIDLIFFGHLTKVLLLELKRTPCDLSFDISAELTAPAKSTKQKNIAQTLNTILLIIIASLIFLIISDRKNDVGLM